jgi:hypothetical protein
MFFHPYLKGDLLDATPEYVLVFVDIGQGDAAKYMGAIRRVSPRFKRRSVGKLGG